MNNREKRLEILEMVRNGTLTEREALMRIKKIGFDDIHDSKNIYRFNDRLKEKIQNDIIQIISEILRINIDDKIGRAHV